MFEGLLKVVGIEQKANFVGKVNFYKCRDFNFGPFEYFDDNIGQCQCN